MLGKRTNFLLPAIATDPAMCGGIPLKSGIVIEVNNKKATLLMKDGTFVTVKIPKGRRPHVGKEYQTSYFSYRKRSLFVLPSLSISVAALVAVFLFLSGLMPFANHSAAAAYVSFDINPSLEVGVDDKMQVVELAVYNDEAKEIIKKYNLSIDDHPSFEKFAGQLIKAYEVEGYMKSDQSMLITTVSSEHGDEETEAELDQAVDSIVKKAAVKYPVAITITESNMNTRKKATQLGVSSGKLTVYQKANKHGEPIQQKKVKAANIQDLQKKISASSKDIKVVPHPRRIDVPQQLDPPKQRKQIQKNGYTKEKEKNHQMKQNSKNDKQRDNFKFNHELEKQKQHISKTKESSIKETEKRANKVFKKRNIQQDFYKNKQDFENKGHSKDRKRKHNKDNNIDQYINNH